MPKIEIIPLDQIQTKILILRNQRVLLDSDLARLYASPTKLLNEQVRRNPNRFPSGFCFQLTQEEVANLRSQNATSSPVHRGRRYRPFAFTGHGAIQAANVLKSAIAVEMSVHVVRAFAQLRQWLGSQKALAAKREELEHRRGAHDEQMSGIIEAIRELTAPSGPTHDRKIGFHPGIH